MRILASGAWLTPERVRFVALISGIVSLAMLFFLDFCGRGTLDPFGQPVGTDFTAFWHAGRLAHLGDPAQAWNQPLLNASVAKSHGIAFGTAWIYPPVFLIVAVPLALLPYLSALLAWQLLSLALVAATFQAVLKNKRETLIALASPLTSLVLANGQNSCLTVALIGGGLLFLERRPRLAAGLIGGLVYKPQLGLIFGPLLLLTRDWRTFAGAAVTAAGLILLSAMIWGLGSWAAFADGLGFARAYMEQGSVGFHKSASLFSVARQWGASIGFSYAVQLHGVIIALVMVWRSSRASPGVRAATACAAAALSTPYLLDYDMAIVGLGAAFLYVEARRGEFLAYERSALAFIWAAPWFSRPVAEYAAVPLSPIAILLLAWFAWRRAVAGLTALRSIEADG